MLLSTARLKLVVVVGVVGHGGLETLADTGGLDDLAGHRGGVEGGTTAHDLPVVEQHGGESLARGGGTEIGVETERLGDGQVSYGLVQTMNIDIDHE